MSEFSPGFRISAMDGFILLAGAVGSILLVSASPAAAFVIGFVVGHFFLFCNVFRISRPLELIWATVFTLLAGATVLTDWPAWAVTTTAGLMVTVVVVISEMRKPSYHGIGWRRINPGLRAWWESHATAPSAVRGYSHRWGTDEHR